MSKQLGQTSAIALASKAKGWSQAELAHRACVDQKTVSQMETGKITQGFALECVRKALGIEETG